MHSLDTSIISLKMYDVSWVNINYSVSKFIDEFFSFLAIPDNKLSFFLNEFFFNDDRYQ